MTTAPLTDDLSESDCNLWLLVCQGTHRHSRFWSGGTSPWSVQSRTVPVATWP